MVKYGFNNVNSALDRVLDGQPNELGLLESSGKKFCENAEETDAV